MSDDYEQHRLQFNSLTECKSAPLHPPNIKLYIKK